MNCIYCKGKLERGTTTCPHCGAPVTSENDPDPAPVSELIRKAVTTVVGDEESRRSGRKSKYIAGILGICFGWLGIHNFYVGRIGRGIVQILICWTGISAVWGFIEGLLCIFGNYRDGEGRPLV